MATENQEVEYSLFFLLFSTRKEEVIRKLLSRNVTPDYFATLFHRDIFAEICDLFKQSKMLSLKVFKTHFLNRPGAKSDDEIKFGIFLNNIKESKVNETDLEHLIDMLVEMYVSRKILAGMNEVVDQMHARPVGELISEFEQKQKSLKNLLEKNSVRTVMGLKAGLDARIERAQKVHDDPDAAGMVCTGLKNIDKWIGRQSPGQFVIYQARTGVGKSMMLMGSALANFKRGLKVIVITIEMSAEDYLYRFDSNLTGISHSEFAMGGIVTDPDKINLWRSRVKKCGKDGCDILVYWVPSNCTPARVDDIIANNPFKPDAIIVDYAGDMKAGLKGVPDYDARSHAEIYSALKEFAGKYECVVYTAQQSKRGTSGKASTESGSWSDVASNKADIMLAVEVTKEDEDFMTEVDGNVVIGRMTVSIIKGRNIPKCKTHIIPRFQRMSWLEKEEEEMMPVGSGKEIKTVKKQLEEKIDNAHKEMEKAMGNAEEKEVDLLADD